MFSFSHLTLSHIVLLMKNNKIITLSFLLSFSVLHLSSVSYFVTLSFFVAYRVEEDAAVSGRHPSESVWLPADAVCGQVAQYTLQGSGSHGGHTGMS